MERVRKGINLVLSAGIITAGAVICAWLLWTKPTAPTRALFSRIPEVTTMPVVSRVERSPIIGHGTVRAKTQIDIVPQVTGKLVHVHPDLATGNIIPKGDLLFQIDSSVYETLVRQAEAKIRGLEAEIARHDQELTNIEQRLINAREMVEIEKRDYETSRRLYEDQNVGTERAVDMAMQKLLRQQDVLVDLESRRAMIPHLRLQTEAQLDAARATLEHATHDLKNTKIFCPFKARVELVQANKSQVVTAHFGIARLTDMEAFEISVGIDPSELRWLDNTIQPDALEEAHVSSTPRVTIRWTLRGHEYTWYGNVTRFERVDEATRTMRLVVEVRDVDMVARLLNDKNAKPQEGPALSIGMFCRTELPARPLEDALVVPRHAVYDNRWVWVFEPDGEGGAERTGTLARRQVPLLRAIGDEVLVDYAGRPDVVACDLEPGDQLITSPLQKPVVGMRVRMRDDHVAAIDSVREASPASDHDSHERRAGTLASGSVRIFGGG